MGEFHPATDPIFAENATWKPRGWMEGADKCQTAAGGGQFPAAPSVAGGWIHADARRVNGARDIAADRRHAAVNSSSRSVVEAGKMRWSRWQV